MKALRFLLFLLAPSIGWAHEFSPSLLELRELEGGDVAVFWKTPSEGEVQERAHFSPVLPAECVRRGGESAHQTFEQLTERWTVRCDLAGKTIAIAGFEPKDQEVLVRLQRRSGSTVVRVLKPDEPSFVVPAAASRLVTLGEWVGVGVHHILGGYDHLLFVLGLLLLTRGRRLWLSLTAFTVAHSLTLTLATFGVVRFPVVAVEAVIALSIVFLAVEILANQDGPRTFAARAPWGVAFAFGLLHGFGFAGALSQAGLAAGEVPLSLFGFNVGVELGQFLCVGAALLVAAALRRAIPRLIHVGPRLAAYVIGALASFWCLERVLALWS